MKRGKQKGVSRSPIPSPKPPPSITPAHAANARYGTKSNGRGSRVEGLAGWSCRVWGGVEGLGCKVRCLRRRVQLRGAQAQRPGSTVESLGSRV
eukprot:2407082-Rhodomonas_salina.1